jgi:mannose-6-phosphate isomerase-like protein (cupin superfamily)
MDDFSTKRLSVDPDVIAPNGSDVRILLGLAGGSMAHFELAPGETSIAVAHRTVEEIWFFLGGRGEMWRKQDRREEVVSVDPGVCIRRWELPPWPGEGEAYPVGGKWQPTVRPCSD